MSFLVPVADLPSYQLRWETSNHDRKSIKEPICIILIVVLEEAKGKVGDRVALPEAEAAAKHRIKANPVQ